MMMFVVFLLRTDPASKKANPACITAKIKAISIDLTSQKCFVNVVKLKQINRIYVNCALH